MSYDTNVFLFDNFCGTGCDDAVLPVVRGGAVFEGEVLKNTEFGVYRRNECGRG